MLKNANTDPDPVGSGQFRQNNCFIFNFKDMTKNIPWNKITEQLRDDPNRLLSGIIQ